MFGRSMFVRYITTGEVHTDQMCALQRNIKELRNHDELKKHVNLLIHEFFMRGYRRKIARKQLAIVQKKDQDTLLTKTIKDREENLFYEVIRQPGARKSPTRHKISNKVCRHRLSIVPPNSKNSLPKPINTQRHAEEYTSRDLPRN
ncbi:hypothetical protein GJ496_002147 [Pomphorhynchus laevis]|nr:hypothetical protein GJ496_002147 [Pomphorhynchus laevis]